uniref:NS4 n=1 Tax=Wallal virus TaxID=40061 RepID=A0A097I4E3_9REOV|nr:NS4 [Wallal virus]
MDQMPKMETVVFQNNQEMEVEQSQPQERITRKRKREGAMEEVMGLIKDYSKGRISWEMYLQSADAIFKEIVETEREHKRQKNGHTWC